ncbi:Nuclear transcription factor Y subunit B-6 [Bienertia sinuspersici]
MTATCRWPTSSESCGAYSPQKPRYPMKPRKPCKNLCWSSSAHHRGGQAQCTDQHRKTITAEDVIGSMAKLGFDDYIEPLMAYLTRYRELDGAEQRRGPHRTEHQLVLPLPPATMVGPAVMPPNPTRGGSSLSGGVGFGAYHGSSTSTVTDSDTVAGGAGASVGANTHCGPPLR